MNKLRNHGPFLGAHMSIAGGVQHAVEKAEQVNSQALQVFTKSSNQWSARPLATEDIDQFRSLREKAKLSYVMSHDSYLINLASPDAVLREKSLRAFLDEIDRADLLGIDYLVFHPGAHMGQGSEEGCRRVSAAMNDCLTKRPKAKVKLLIENAAGQGTTLGRTFEELAMIRDGVEDKARTGFCIDTCHTYAAGYDLRTKETYEATMTSLDNAVGIRNVLAFHINDCKKDLGCHVDRHDHIGKGTMTLKPFEFLLNDPRFSESPMVLETPKSDDLHEDIENLETLRSLIR